MWLGLMVAESSLGAVFWRRMGGMTRCAALVGVRGLLGLVGCGLLVAGCGAFERSARAEASRGRGPVAVEARGESTEPQAQAEQHAEATEAQAERTGLQGEVERADVAASVCASAVGPIASTVTQLVVVTSVSFDAWRAELRRFERVPGGVWQSVGEPVSVVLGRSGYAWGDGVHGAGVPAGRSGPIKREGDGRSPAGVFALGNVHGYAAAAPAGMSLPYGQASAALRCIDDPRAAEYNRIVEAGARGERWRSAERMRREDAVYELALDIEHNRSPVVPGHGSCIFAHVWVNAQTPVAGCTGMALGELRRVLTWLKPGALWVALPVAEYRALSACWKLPEIVAIPNQG